MKTSHLFSFLSLITSLAFSADIPDGWFAFQTDARIAPAGSLASVAFLNTGKANQRIIVKNGHFATQTGVPVRFIGTNTCYDKAFPDKDIAPLVARRMAQLGFNVVRFHSMDHRDIWNKDQTELDPQQLDRLHWFLFQLKENGIYANINLHVTRNYPGMSSDLRKLFHYGKAIDRYHPEYIKLQRKYAKDLLTTVNPYTGMSLAEDPGVAFVEVNNENTMANLDKDDSIDAIRDTPYGASLASLWQAWLVRKYGDLANAQAAWSQDIQPYSAINLLTAAEPKIEGSAPGEFTVSIPQSCNLDCSLLKDGKVAWAYQVHYPVPLKSNQHYTIRFKARSSQKRLIHVNLRIWEAPWTVYHNNNVTLTPEWQEFTFAGAVNELMPDKIMSFTLNLDGFHTPVDIQFQNLELHEGDIPYDFSKIASLNAFPLPQPLMPAKIRTDFRKFLMDTEFHYTQDMEDYLRKDLHVKALIADTQASYAGAYGLLRESTYSDYIDMHSYWQHPNFEAGHSWSPLHWTIPNTPMVDSENGGTFSNLARYNYVGMPYSLSEYDHPTPNEHNQEMFPLLGSFAAFQDWDALYQFSFVLPPTKDTPVRLAGYFAMAPNPGKMVLAPFAAMMFRGRLVSPAAQTATISIPQVLLEKELSSHIPNMNSIGLKGIPTTIIGSAQVKTRFVNTGKQVQTEHSELLSGLPMATPQINWKAGKGKGLYTVNAPAVRIAAGHIDNGRQQLGDMSFEMTVPPQDTAVMAITALDGKAVAESQRLLAAIVGTIANPGMVWNEERTTIKDKWGTAPAIAKFIPAVITLPGSSRPKVVALDPQGTPFAEMPVDGAPGRWTFRTSPETPTLWFAITR